VLCIPETFPLRGDGTSLGRTRGCSFIGPDIIPSGTSLSHTHRYVHIYTDGACMLKGLHIDKGMRFLPVIKEVQ